MARKNSTTITVKREVQDLKPGMVVMAGGRVFRVKRVVPLPGFQAAQIITRRGNILDLPVSHMVAVRAYVKL
jgi:hypothetical protein